jgi:DNA-directed RNA polymerase specialized sigma24 family protein
VADDCDVEVAELAAIARGDREAFYRCFARCEIPLKRSLRGFAQVVDVEAIVQDTGIRLSEHASRIEPRRPAGFVLRWAFTVALNAARTQARRAGRLVPLDLHPDALRPAISLAGDPFLRARIRQRLEGLPANPRRVLARRLADAGQHPDRELASEMSMTFDAFRQNLARARRALEHCLHESGIDVRKYL